MARRARQQQRPGRERRLIGRGGQVRPMGRAGRGRLSRRAGRVRVDRRAGARRQSGPSDGPAGAIPRVPGGPATRPGSGRPDGPTARRRAPRARHVRSPLLSVNCGLKPGSQESFSGAGHGLAGHQTCASKTCGGGRFSTGFPRQSSSRHPPGVAAFTRGELGPKRGSGSLSDAGPGLAGHRTRQ